jgi:hypothetical protein
MSVFWVTGLSSDCIAVGSLCAIAALLLLLQGRRACEPEVDALKQCLSKYKLYPFNI